jgi:hypothetical protein
LVRIPLLLLPLLHHLRYLILLLQYLLLPRLLATPDPVVPAFCKG